MAVVKADAFGHGAVPVARSCLAAGASWLGVTRIGEGIELRRAGLTAPLLAWLHDSALADPGACPRHRRVREQCGRPGSGGPAARGGARPIHLKLDTGMHRSGCPGEDWARLARTSAELERAGIVRVVGIWSHLSHGGEPGAIATHRQLLMFRVGVAIARGAGLRPPIIHLANTAAVQLNPALTRHDLVRVGAGLFGIGEGLRPALTLRTKVVQVRPGRRGPGVGYNHVQRTTRDTHLALVPIGYAEGSACRHWPRRCPGPGPTSPLIGEVSMDQVVADVGPEPVAVGDPVVILGPGDDGEPTARDWAR